MIERLQGFLKAHFHSRRLLQILMAYVIFNSLVEGMNLVLRGMSEELARPIIVVSILICWLLVDSGISEWWIFLGGGLGGFFLIVSWVGNLLQPFWDTIKESGWMVWQGLRWVWNRSPLDPAGLETAWANLRLQTSEVFLSLWRWVVDVSTGFTGFSYLANQVIWGTAVWLLLLWFFWAVMRWYRPLWGLVPVTVVMGILYTYLPRQGIFWLVTALGAALILIGITHYEDQVRGWKAGGIPWEEKIWQRTFWVLVGVSSAVMVLAAVTPSVYLDEITGPIQERLWKENRDEGVFQSLLGIESGQEEDPEQVLRRFGLPRRHLIGLQEELSQQVVMVVRFPPGSPSQEELPPLAFYWRSFTFDFYTGSGWASGTTRAEEFPPSLNYHTYPLDYYRTIRQEIRVNDDLRGTLYAPGMPLSVDRESQVFWRRTGEDQAPFKSILADDIYAVTITNPVYQVYSILPVVDEQVLQNTSPFYSRWIENRYLQLPEDLPQRVYDLAEELVEKEYTPYDEAKAIEAYVSTFPYTLDLPEPPYDQDVTDYFLFELQKGYCDYYATSMAVLARAVGLPARVVIGYAGAYFDEAENRYLITEADAHTWVEIYFPEVGWIPFEPTAGRSGLDPKSNREPLPVPKELDKPPQTFGPREGFDWPTVMSWAIPAGSLLTLMIILGGIYWKDLRYLKRGTPSQTILHVYQRMARWGERLEVVRPAAATPYEFEGLIMAKLSHYQWYTGRRYGLIPAPEQLSLITDAFIKDRYQSLFISGEEADDVVQLWQRVRLALLAARIIKLRLDLTENIKNWKVFVWFRELWRRL